MKKIAYFFLPVGRLPILLCNHEDALRDAASMKGYADLCQRIVDRAPYLEVWQ